MICFAVLYLAAVAHLWRMVGREITREWPQALMGIGDD